MALQLRDCAVGIMQCMKHLLVSGELSDVQFSVGRDHGEEKIFPAHKYIVSMRSDVFHAMFYENVSGDDVVDFPNITPESFANMLKYIYTDAVEDLDEANVFPTLYCAEKFELPWLVELCMSFALDHLRVNNCLAYLENVLCWSIVSSSLIQKCWTFLDKNFEDILRLEQFKTIKMETLRMILRRDTLCVQERNVYCAVMVWAEAACQRNNLEPAGANRRRILGDTLFFIRFPLLSDELLARGPVKDNLLLPTELWDIYRHKHDTPRHPVPFPTEPRKYVEHQIGEVIFEDKEEVFIRRDEGQAHWDPGRIIGIRESMFVYSTCHYPNAKAQYMSWSSWTARPERIVRAVTVVRPGSLAFTSVALGATPLDYGLCCVSLLIGLCFVSGRGIARAAQRCTLLNGLHALRSSCADQC